MNAPSPSFRRSVTSSPETDTTPTLVTVAHTAHPAANESTNDVTQTAERVRAVNPLWMITVALAMLIGLLLLLAS